MRAVLSAERMVARKAERWVEYSVVNSVVNSADSSVGKLARLSAVYLAEQWADSMAL